MLPTREVAPRALGDLLKRQPMSDAKVKFAWLTSVGPSVARATSVVLDAAGTLRVTTETEHWRREIARSRVVIARRLAALMGAGTVKKLSVKRRGRA